MPTDTMFSVMWKYSQSGVPSSWISSRGRVVGNGMWSTQRTLASGCMRKLIVAGILKLCSIASAVCVLRCSNSGVLRSTGGNSVKRSIVDVLVVNAVEKSRGFQLSTGEGTSSRFSVKPSSSSDGIDDTAVECSEKSDDRRESVDVDMMV